MVAIPHQALLAITTSRSGVSTVWNAADKNANIILSNASLTGTCGAAAQSGVRGTVSHAGSGKYYLEFNTLSDGGAANFVGFGLSTAPLTSTNAGNSGQIALGASGFLNVSGSFYTGTGLANPNAGANVAFALDIFNQKVWVRVNGGLWNNDAAADPATDINGKTGGGISAAAAWFPMMAMGAVGAAGTLNGGNSGTPFSFSVPAGFSNWDT